jgi:hypothetical protein
MIQKSRARLLVAGLGFLAVAGAVFYLRRWWPVGFVAALIGAYLLVWATAGKARWCRECKSFRVVP